MVAVCGWRWCGGVVVWWCGGVVVWWCGGVVVWWCGGVVVWWCGGGNDGDDKNDSVAMMTMIMIMTMGVT